MVPFAAKPHEITVGIGAVVVVAVAGCVRVVVVLDDKEVVVVVVDAGCVAADEMLFKAAVLVTGMDVSNVEEVVVAVVGRSIAQLSEFE